MNSFEFRPARLADIPQLVDLMNSQYARKKDGGYFRWQYFEGTYPTVMMCAFDEGELLGMFGLQQRYTNNGVECGQAIDLLISPRLRGKGIFQEMSRRVEEMFPSLAAFCVLPNLNGRNACVKSLGWPAIAKIDSLCLNAAENIRPFVPDLLQPLEEQETTSFRYTPEIRNWRYAKHPDYRYEIVELKQGFFAITKFFQDPVTGKRYGDIVDFCADHRDLNGLAELFSRAVGQLKGEGIESITTWALPHTQLYAVLSALGFRGIPQERYFCVKVLDPAYEYLGTIENWHLLQADAEFY